MGRGALPDPSPEDWYRTLTVALLASEELPFPLINGVALGMRGLTILMEKEDEGLIRAFEERFQITPAFRVIGPIVSIARGGDWVGDGAHNESGTLGCLVKDAGSKQYFLTCDHVVGNLAGQNIGDPVESPSWAHRTMTNPSVKIGDFVKSSSVSLSAGVQNRVDAALVSLSNPAAHSSSIKSIGAVRGVNSTFVFGDNAEKYGAATSLTKGEYVYKMSHRVPYNKGNALFVDQMGLECAGSPFAQPGDSGSLVVDTSGNAVSLLFAAAPQSNLGFANPISDVLQALGVSIV
jgi:hypothetical protein